MTVEGGRPIRLSGVFPALPTPFDPDGDLDLPALAALVESLNDSPLAGYLTLGTNGEAVHVSDEEASRVYETVRRAAAPGKLVLGGTGLPSTRATLERTRRAAGAGCDAVLVLTPSFYKTFMTHEAFVRHYTAVADASPVPVLLYNMPAASGLNLSPATAAALAPHPNVAGMKDSSGDVGQLAELTALSRSHAFQVLSGSFAAALPGLTLGISGAILAVANVAPHACCRLLALFHEGRIAEAGELHQRLLPLARAVTTRHGLAGLKAALQILGKPAGLPRAPVLPVEALAREEIGRLLADVLGGEPTR